MSGKNPSSKRPLDVQGGPRGRPQRGRVSGSPMPIGRGISRRGRGGHSGAPVFLGEPPAIPPIPDQKKSFKESLQQVSEAEYKETVDYPLKKSTSRGNLGEPINIYSNHFMFDFNPKNFEIQRYAVEIIKIGRLGTRPLTKEISGKVFDVFLENHKDVVLGTPLCFDKSAALYSAGKLNLQSGGKNEFEFECTIGERPGTWKVTLEQTNVLQLSRIKEYLRGDISEEPLDVLQALDVACRQECSKVCVSVGQSFFHPKIFGLNDLGLAIVAVNGFFQSLRPLKSGLALNLDTTATAFYSPQMVPDFLKDFLEYQNFRVQHLLENEEAFKRANSALKKLVVEMKLQNGPKRRYTLSGLSRKTPETAMFTLNEMEENITPQETSVFQYFREKYQMNVIPNFPLLISRKGKREFLLPIELCQICIGQRYSRKLNEGQISNLIRSTCCAPRDRLQKIQDIAKKSLGGMKNLLEAFGLRVRPTLTSISCRLLEAPALRFGDKGQKAAIPDKGAWNLMGKSVVNPTKVKKWVVINQSEVSHAEVDNFWKKLITEASKMGIEISPPSSVTNCSPFGVDQEITRAISTCGTDLEMSLIILGPQNNKKSYEMVKKVCETELGIVSQCVSSRNVPRVKPQYLANLLLKINSKMGGRNHLLVEEALQNLPLVSDVPTCIMGADVSHPPPFDQSQPSIASLVASVDWPCANKYASVAVSQKAREELLRNLYLGPEESGVSGGMARELLLKFHQNVGCFPQRIIMFRDGVGEGQFQQVLDCELHALKHTCRSLGFSPKFTFVVVNKKHHTRLFPGKNCPTDNSGNVMPGTLVDVDICHPTAFDFFLCSHAGIQGTSRPAHYHVIFDENEVTPDDMYSLVFKLCFTYARCTRSVSVVPPAYYAHLAAVRARCWIQEDIENVSLSSGEEGGGQSQSRVIKLPLLRGIVANGMHFC